MTIVSETIIPEGWESCDLRSFGTLIGGGTPSRVQPAYWNGSIPWASVKDFCDDQVYLYDTKEHISPEGLASSAANLVPENTPVICTRMAVGRCALTTQPTAINQDLKAFLMKDGIDRRFFIRLLQYNGPDLDKISVGSTVRGITIGDLLSHKVLRPRDKNEQTSIAYVLDTIDEGIARTAAVIVKLKQVRAGMLHDLLSYGLDEHGQLRDPIAHPEQFKDSPLGLIPREWDSGPLSQIIPSAEYGISTSLGDRGHPVLRMNNLSEGEAELSDLKYSIAPIPESLWLRSGDVLFNRTNSWEHVGRTGIWRGQIERATFASYLVRLNPNPDRLISELLNLWLNWPVTQIAIRRIATPAVQQVNINPTNLRQVQAAFPISINEQTEIVARIDNQDKAIRAARAEHIKFQHLQAGLQDDLLTGRVRVPETIMEGAENA